MQKKNETSVQTPPAKKKLELNLRVKVLEPKTAPKPGPLEPSASPVIGYS